jgi:hypothetical protein
MAVGGIIKYTALVKSLVVNSVELVNHGSVLQKFCVALDVGLGLLVCVGPEPMQVGNKSRK